MTAAGTLEAATASLQHTLGEAQRALQDEGNPTGAAAELRARISGTRAALASLHASLAAQLREGVAGRCGA